MPLSNISPIYVPHLTFRPGGRPTHLTGVLIRLEISFDPTPSVPDKILGIGLGMELFVMVESMHRVPQEHPAVNAMPCPFKMLMEGLGHPYVVPIPQIQLIIHALSIQDKRGFFKKWALFLYGYINQPKYLIFNPFTGASL